MPKFDGTGPQGLGPMSGGVRGLCILKLPQKPDEPVTGFAGQSGRRVFISSASHTTDVMNLKSRVQYIGAMLNHLRSRVYNLEVSEKP